MCGGGCGGGEAADTGTVARARGSRIEADAVWINRDSQPAHQHRQPMYTALRLSRQSSAPLLRAAARAQLSCRNRQSRRTIFSLFKRKTQTKPDPKPVLSQDDLFHHFSQSPFPAVRARGEAIQSLAPCPVCAPKPHAEPKNVAFECPDCGWPTHCTEEHWKADEEHQKYCSRLREVNEDEHDLRSGRRLREFELPGALPYPIFRRVEYRALTLLHFALAGPQDSESAISFANWDVFWYTRNFSSMDTERSRRHASKLLTYPITIGSTIHQYSNLTLSSQRLTPEGSRSLAGAYTLSQIVVFLGSTDFGS